MKSRKDFDSTEEYQEYLRTYFAAMAMQGLCANSIPGSHRNANTLTKEAVEMADALLTHLASE